MPCATHPKLRPHSVLYVDPNQSWIAGNFLNQKPIVQSLSFQGAQILSVCDGDHSLEEISKTYKIKREDLEGLISRWYSEGFFTTEHDDPEKRRLTEIARQMKKTYLSAKRVEGAHDVHLYHAHEIKDAFTQFNEVEITLSHYYKVPHAALKGRSYGEALCDQFLESRLLRPGMTILEIGCGTGLMANAFLSRLKEKDHSLYSTVDYVMFDLSPALQTSQRKICRDHLERIQFVLGNIVEPGLKESSFDLVLANEMIADLKVQSAKKENVEQKIHSNLAEELISHYALEVKKPPPEFVVNTGAIKFIETLSRLLAPGGSALVTEFGTTAADEYPVEVVLGNHKEYSIRFNDLVKVAFAQRLEPKIQSVASFLKFDQDLEILSFRSAYMLSRILEKLSKPKLERTAYDRKALADLLGNDFDKFKNLEWHSLRENPDPLNPSRFVALTLKKEI